MAFINWSDKLSVGVQQMDMQHKRLGFGLLPFLVPVAMRVSCTYSPCLEQGVA